MEIPTIQAIDELDGTIYVLRRPRQKPVSAPWPQPLERLCPDAVRIPAALGSEASDAY